MTIVTYTDTQAFAGLREEWSSLARRGSTHSIFLSWQWQKVWWDFFGSRGRLCLLTVRDGADLVGLAPFYTSAPDERPRMLRLIGGVEVSDYLDIIVAAGSEQTVYSTLWEFLSHEMEYPWEVIDLHNLPARSSTRAALPALASKTDGVQVTMQVEDVCPVISLPSTWDAYLSLLNKKQRHELRRKIRKAHREATVRWYCVEDGEALQAEMEDFVELHQKSGGHKKVFMDQRMQGFFQAMARTLLEQGWLRLSFLLIDDIKAAAMFCFDYSDSISVYNSGYDPQLYSSLSPGIVLLGYCIQDAIDRRRTTFDFLRGDEEYKYRLGAQETKVYNLRLSR